MAHSIFQLYVTVMEQEYKQIRKGSGFVYACANMLYRRVKTEGNIKYVKCHVVGCDGSAKLIGEHFFLGVCNSHCSNVHLCVTCEELVLKL